MTTIKHIVKQIKSNNSIKQMVNSINNTSELKVTEKQLNEYFYGESYNNIKLYESCESFIKIM